MRLDLFITHSFLDLVADEFLIQLRVTCRKRDKGLMQRWHARIASLTARLSWAPPIVARLVAGILFLTSGWGKIGHLDEFIGQFAGWGFPAPQLLAPFVSGAELLCGALLIAGLLTRLAAIAMLINMAVALSVVRIKDIHTLGDFLYLPEVLLIALMFWLVVEGPGKVSSDYSWKKVQRSIES